MSFLRFFVENDSIDKIIQALKEDNEALTDRLNEAYRVYCPLCKRGFDRFVGKSAHDRIKHSDNPPILGRKKSLEQTPKPLPIETNIDTIPSQAPLS